MSTNHEDEPVGFDDAIAELRGRLDGASPGSAWAAITEAIDACTPEHLHDLVTYVAGFASRLVPDERTRWRSPARRDRHLVTTFGEVRIAPDSWLQSIFDGEEAPELSLIRALTLAGCEAPSVEAARIFERPELSSLRALDLGNPYREFALDEDFFSAMARATNLESLESLTLNRGLRGAAHVLEDASWLERIRHLHVRGLEPETLYELPALTGVETLIVSEPSHLERLAASNTALARVRRLVLLRATHWSRSDTRSALGSEPPDSLRHIEECVVVHCTYAVLRRACSWLGDDQWFDRIRHLDLHATLESAPISGDAGIALYRELLERSGLARSLERVTLPDHVMGDVRDAVRAMGVEVTKGPADSEAPVRGTGMAPAPRPAPGERGAGRVRVADGLQWRDPGPLAWDIVYGTALGLDATLEGGERDGALRELAEGIAHWPERYRRALTDLSPVDPRAERSSPRPRYSVAEGLGRAHAYVELIMPHHAQAFAQARDLRHVLTMDLAIDPFAAEWLIRLSESTPPLSLPSLVSLRVRHTREIDALDTGLLLRAVAAICPNIRPVVFGGAAASYPWARLEPAVHDAGVLSCTYGTCLSLPQELSIEDTERMLGSGRWRAMALEVTHHPSRERLNAMPVESFARAIHPDSAASLRALRWHVAFGDLLRLEALLDALPRLTSLCLDVPAGLITDDASLTHLIELLSELRGGARLERVNLVGHQMTRANYPTLSPRHLERLERGGGVSTHALILGEP